MARIRFTVELDVDGDPARMAELFADYLVSPEGSFAEDYSYQTWGGHDGPFVTGVCVTLPNSQRVESHDWPTMREPASPSRDA